MDVGMEKWGDEASPAQVGITHASMILLDTNALIFILADSRRARHLLRGPETLYVSPVCILELKFLEEVGKGRFISDDPISDVVRDPRWTLDDPSVAALVSRAMKIDWTRDL